MSEPIVYYTQVPAWNGIWTLLGTDKGVCRLLYPHNTLESATPWIQKYVPGAKLVENEPIFHKFGILEKLAAYFQGKKVSFEDIPLDLLGTEFQKEVWAELGRIPYGETSSYRDIAIAVGKPKATRAVGMANGANPLPVILPCHRVIGIGRKLTGYRGGLTIKESLLKLEGVDDFDPSGHDRFKF